MEFVFLSMQRNAWLNLELPIMPIMWNRVTDFFEGTKLGF